MDGSCKRAFKLAFRISGVNVLNVKRILVTNPLGKRILLTPILLVSLTIFSSVSAQETAEVATGPSPSAVQVRIERARALAAAHRLGDAARDLESLRSTVGDEVVRNVTSVMLMSIYLEEGNYTRAESLLEETFRARSSQKERSIRTYFVLAGQAVNGARAHIARYRNFGINVTDAQLPAEALADLNRLRSLLERMIAQAREITKDDSKAYDSLALLEDVLGIRLSVAREGEDVDRWANEYADARQGLSSSQKQVASLNGIPQLTSAELKSPAAGKAAPAQPASSPSPNSAQPNPAEAQAAKESVNTNTLSVGALNHWATKKVVPVYPPLAKSTGVVGVVRVYVTTDSDGKVVDVSRSEGPLILKQAAEFAARQWRFQPAIVADKRFGLVGFIEFNFTL
ncbi:MAG TPA: TonB family protein [Pyrinomonadaceae bacterium]|nr:TonB family protein [Pyrinomonadaceae bacterium]